MLFSSYIYYTIFNLILVVTLFMYLNKFFFNSFFSNLKFLTNFFLTFFVFMFLFTILSLVFTLNTYHSLFFYSSSYLNFNVLYLFDTINLRDISYYNLIKVYYFPFIYVFILITILSVIFCMTYNRDELSSFMFFIIIIFIGGYSMFFTNSLILFFFFFEMLLVPSFFILYRFAKTRKCVEASYLMFFWTQFGAMFLIFAILYILNTQQSASFYLLTCYNYSNFEINFLFLCLFIGFGVKLPIWPFYGWLPKAHVEASTNFSIFLSGVLVKFAFFGLLKILVAIQLEPTFVYVIPFLFIGIFDSVFKLFYQIDLKKLVAYSTVIEMHWLTLCLISGQSNLILASFCMLISHALLSTNSFLLVDSISRRYKTRLVTEISGVNFLTPKLFLTSLLNLLIFLGFPGSLFFVSEFLFFSFSFEMFPLLTLLFLILLYLLGPTFFFKSWVNVLFGSSSFLNKSLPLDLTSREFLLFNFLSFLMFWLGSSWQSFII